MSLEDRPRYTPSTTFETFPFPAGLTPDVPAADYADDPRAIAVSMSTIQGEPASSAAVLIRPYLTE